MLLSYILNYRIFNSWVIPPPKEGSLRYNLYKKKEGGGGSSPLFGVNWRAVSRLSWPLFCSGIKIPLSWGISMKQKQRDRFVKTLVFCQHISSWPRDFEKGIWLVVCRENRVLLWNRAEQDPGEWSWEWSRCGLLGRDAIIWYFNRIKIMYGEGYYNIWRNPSNLVKKSTSIILALACLKPPWPNTWFYCGKQKCGGGHCL